MAELILPSGAIKVIQTQQNMVGSAIVGGAGSVTNNVSNSDNTPVVGVLEQIREVSLKSFRGITKVATLLADTLNFEKANARRERDQAAELEKERKSKLGAGIIGPMPKGGEDEDGGGVGAGGGFLAGLGLAPLLKKAQSIGKKIIAPFARLLTSLGRLTGLAGLFTRLAPLLAPLGPVGAIAAALFLIVQYADEIAKVLAPIIDGLKKTFEILKPIIQPIFELADFMIKLALGELATALTAAFRMVNNTLSFLVDNFIGLNEMLAGIVTGDFDLIKKGFTRVKTAFQTLGDKILNAIIGAVNGLIDALPFVPQKIKDKMKFDKVGAEAPQEETKPETKTPDSKKSLFTSDKAYNTDTTGMEEVIELPKTKNVDKVTSVADTAEKVMKAEPAVYTEEQKKADLELYEQITKGGFGDRYSGVLKDLQAQDAIIPMTQASAKQSGIVGEDYEKYFIEKLKENQAKGIDPEDIRSFMVMQERYQRLNQAKMGIELGDSIRSEIFKNEGGIDPNIIPSIKTPGKALGGEVLSTGTVTVVNNQPQNINTSTNVAKNTTSSGPINVSSGDNYFDRQSNNVNI